MKFLYYLLILSFTLFNTLSAETIQWTGNVSDAWSEPNNWDCNCLPSSEDDVEIPFNSTPVLDMNATVKSFILRGDFLIPADFQLTIDGQNSGENIGLGIFANGITIEGTLLITGVVDRSSIQSFGGTTIVNNGELIIDQPRCVNANCISFDVATLSGEVTNNGLFKTINPDVYDVVVTFGTLTNNGTLEIEDANISGTALGMGQESTFINSTGATCRIENIVTTGNLARGIQNFINDVTIVNDGLISIHTEEETLRSIDLTGSNTSFINRGDLNVSGGTFGMNLNNIASLRNEGSINFSGQSNLGLDIRGAGVVENEGSWLYNNGNATTVLQFLGAGNHPQFINRGDFLVEDYLSGSNEDKAIIHVDGLFHNFGTVELEGNGMGLGWEVSIDSLVNYPSGYIRCNNFEEAFEASPQFVNQGSLIFGPDLDVAFSNGSQNIRNAGLIGGAGNMQSSAIDWLEGGSLEPGDGQSIGQIIMINDLNLPANNTIVLDIGSGNADQILTFSKIDFNGTIQLQLTDDFEPQSTNFLLLDTGEGLTGEPSVELPELPANWEWILEQDANSIRLQLDMVSSTQETDGQKDIMIYPNPTKSEGVILIETGENLGDQEVYLSTIEGRLIERFFITHGQGQLRLPAIKPGTYLLRIGNKVNRLLVF